MRVTLEPLQSRNIVSTSVTYGNLLRQRHSVGETRYIRVPVSKEEIGDSLRMTSTNTESSRKREITKRKTP